MKTLHPAPGSKTVPPAHASARSVHLVGRMTADVFSLLGPLTRTLARRGVEQTVIVRDDPAFRHLLDGFAPSVKLVLVPDARNTLVLMASMARALSAVAASGAVDACHLHGFVPALVGAWVHCIRKLKARIYVSPHGSRVFGWYKPLGQALFKTLRFMLQGADTVPVVGSPEEARRLLGVVPGKVQLVECPVGEAFFRSERTEAERPLVVSGTAMVDDAAAARFAQIAVLYWNETQPAEFLWLGPVSLECAALLQAARVQVAATADEAQRVGALTRAWTFVSLGATDGFPSLLAEAMASGVPAIAWNRVLVTAYVRHGDNGLIAKNEVEMLEALAGLLDDFGMRRRLGTRARSDAQVRFNHQAFELSMLSAYEGVASFNASIQAKSPSVFA